jgi:hypothetical protein
MVPPEVDTLRPVVVTTFTVLANGSGTFRSRDRISGVCYNRFQQSFTYFAHMSLRRWWG